MNCPLHQDSDRSLEMHPGENSTFSCSHPTCRFTGDAVSLVALARKITPKQAIELFQPGGEFSDCLKDPLRTDEIDAYIANADTQSALKAYLAKCKRALRLSPEKARIRPGISQSSVRLLHPDIGMFMPGDDVPKCLSEFMKPKYRGSCLILYPYTANGEITKIDVYDTSNPVFFQTVVVTHPRLGVFGEELCTGSNRMILACEDPRMAAVLYATHALFKENLKIASFQGYPLPESMSGTSGIRIVSTQDRPVSTEFLIRALSAPEIVHGLQPNITVWKTQLRSDDVKEGDIEDALSDPARKQTLSWLVIQRLEKAMRDCGESKVLELLSSEQIPVVAKNLLVEEAHQLEAKNGPDSDMIGKLVELLRSSKLVQTADIRLANGQTLHRGPTELYATNANGRSVLCNVGFSVDSKILSFDGEDIYVCRATHQDADVPTVEVRIPGKWAGSPDRIQDAVAKAFSAKGCNPYIAFYNAKGCTWRDIMSKLSDHCAVSREIDSLGVDAASDIHLPEFVVRADGSVKEQRRIFTMPEGVLRAYSGLPLDTESGLEPYRDLLSKCGNLYVAAFALGFFHVVYQMTFGVFKPAVAKDHMPRHFFYVETEPGIWGAVFRQLSGLFSGNDFTPTVNYAEPGKTFDQFKQLGCLPLIAYLPTIGSKLAGALDCSGVDLLGLMDTSTAVMSNGKMSAVYVTPSEDSPMERGIIDGRGIDLLRRSFAPFLSRFVKEARIDTAYRSSSMPCLAAYDEACRIMGVDANPLLERLAKGYFPGVGMNGATIFFDLLHRSVVDDGKPTICIVNGEPQRGYSFTRRGQHAFVMKDVVIVSHMVADIYNQSSKGQTKFDIDQLTSEMEATGMLSEMPDLGIDGSRCWCMKRDVWEARVVRPPINLHEEVKAGTIQIGPIG